ncbi:hypothetical protein CC80DRAFT_227461 [Byssothecium circinans]|uniref:C2H2-type domain-containing protein n=1 Tax=Byssothecium circinans TaxID=147558 RepID=A0A6A5TNG2_9PLEO|nr:hypothetical protein CC80DRAFT_227461 [Byssothecium circinans]
MGEVYSHLNKAHPLFVAACPVCKLIVESREAKASHGDNFEMCGREKSQWSDLGVHWEALFRKLYPAILAVPSAYHGERNSSPVPHGNVRYVDRVAPAQYPSTRGSRPGTPVHSIPPQRRIMDMPFQSRPSSPNPAASTSSTFPTVGHAITSPSIPLETLPEAHLPKDIIAENRILRELLLKDRRERLPEGERDSVASQVEDEIRLWLQREQSATVPNFTSRSAGSHAPWSLFNTHNVLTFQPLPSFEVTSAAPASMAMRPTDTISQSDTTNTVQPLIAPGWELSDPEGLTYDSFASTSASASASTPAATLECVIAGCDAKFSGEYRKGNLARHIRLRHAADGRIYPCAGCTKKFNRQDARLKHYRRRHPHLGPGPPLPRANRCEDNQS